MHHDIIAQWATIACSSPRRQNRSPKNDPRRGVEHQRSCDDGAGQRRKLRGGRKMPGREAKPPIAMAAMNTAPRLRDTFQPGLHPLADTSMEGGEQDQNPGQPMAVTQPRLQRQQIQKTSAALTPRRPPARMRPGGVSS